MREKVRRNHQGKEEYTEERWDRLHDLREKALGVMSLLREHYCIAYGSITRGDVTKNSDVDIFVEAESHILELLLRDSIILERTIVQATPWQAVKGTIILENGVEISFPLSSTTKKEEEFYRFGGALSYEAMKKGKRVCGVNKNLILITPTKKGHRERSIIGRESETAKQLDLSVDIVRERVQVLTRRDAVGRTGVYLQRVLAPSEGFGEVLKKLVDTDANVRRRYL